MLVNFCKHLEGEKANILHLYRIHFSVCISVSLEPNHPYLSLLSLFSYMGINDCNVAHLSFFTFILSWVLKGETVSLRFT